MWTLTGWGRSNRVVVRIAWALALVALVSAAIAAARTVTSASNVAIVYVVAVLAAAVTAGSAAAVAAAIASFFAYDLFFIAPHFALTVADPVEWVNLALLLTTGIVTGQLAGVARRREQEARAGERDAVVQYEVARALADDDIERALHTAAAVLREATRVEAVLIRAQVGPRDLSAAAGDPRAAQQLLRSGRLGAGRVLGEPRGEERGAFRARRWVGLRPPRLRSAPATTPASAARAAGRRFDHVRIASARGAEGWISLASGPRAEFSVADQRLLATAAAQIGQAVDRARLHADATEAEVLRRADDLKNALLNTVSHDLRTPLASIVASADSLLQGDVAWSDGDRREFLSAIADEGRRLDRMVRHLLDFSRVQGGALRIEPEWRDLATLVADTLDRLSEHAAGYLVVADLPADLPPVRMDAIAIGEVIGNLVENAVRHTPSGTEIRLSASVLPAGESGGGPAVEVAIADDGPGIAPEALAHLFDPFAAAERGRGGQGTGLGLAVARALVEAHGGAITAANGSGGGARFAFRIPLDPAPGDPGAPPPAGHPAAAAPKAARP